MYRKKVNFDTFKRFIVFHKVFYSKRFLLIFLLINFEWICLCQICMSLVYVKPEIFFLKEIFFFQINFCFLSKIHKSTYSCLYSYKSDLPGWKWNSIFSRHWSPHGIASLYSLYKGKIFLTNLNSLIRVRFISITPELRPSLPFWL